MTDCIICNRNISAKTDKIQGYPSCKYCKGVYYRFFKKLFDYMFIEIDAEKSSLTTGVANYIWLILMNKTLCTQGRTWKKFIMENKRWSKHQNCPLCCWRTIILKMRSDNRITQRGLTKF